MATNRPENRAIRRSRRKKLAVRICICNILTTKCDELVTAAPVSDDSGRLTIHGGRSNDDAACSRIGIDTGPHTVTVNRIANPNAIISGNHTGPRHHMLRVRVLGPLPRPVAAKSAQSPQGHAELPQQAKVPPVKTAMTSRASHRGRRDFPPNSRRFLSLLSVGTRALATPLCLFSMTYKQQVRQVFWSGGGESEKGSLRCARIDAGCLRAFPHAPESPRSPKLLKFQ